MRARLRRHTALCRLGLLLLGISASASCNRARMYDGPAQARSSVAAVYTQSAGNDFGIPHAGDVKFEARFVRFDGRPIGGIKTFLELLPGEHRFDVCWSRYDALCYGGPWADPTGECRWSRTESGVVVLTLVAEVGAAYELRWARVGDNLLPAGFERR